MNDAAAHCSGGAGSVKKLDDYYYCCMQNSCCHHDDDECAIGDTCCLDDCDDPLTCAYTDSGCEGKYGQLHGCQLDDKFGCVVGK